MRISTNLLASKATDISPGITLHFMPAQSTLTPVQGATDTMYFATHGAHNDEMIILRWPEFSNVPSTQIVQIPPWLPSLRGSMKCPSPDGHNACARADNRILNGWIRNDIIGFYWNAAQDPDKGFPFPHLDAATFKITPGSNQVTFDSSPIIWNSRFAYVYGYAAPTISQLGIVAYKSGGGHFPTVVAGLAGTPRNTPGSFSINFIPESLTDIAKSTAAPTTGEWGDYIRIRQCNGGGPLGFIISAYTLDGPSPADHFTSNSIFPHYFVVGSNNPSVTKGAQQPCDLGPSSSSFATSNEATLSNDAVPFQPAQQQVEEGFGFGNEGFAATN